MRFFTPLKGALIASRIPNLIIIGLTQFLSTYMLMRHGLIISIGLPFVLLTVSTMMVAAGGYVINDYYDAKIDMVNRPNQVVVGRSLSRRKALAYHLIISSLAIIIGFFVSWKLALIHFFAVALIW
jgi:4-hydroxybenzoate polyprenyltransferase